MLGQLLIERYLIIEQLGSGGFSKTYLVRDKYMPNNPLCIVKQLHFEGHNTLTKEDAHTLFDREATILSSLGRSSDRIPILLAYVQNESNPCLVEEYIEGETLEAITAQGKTIKPKEATALLKSVLTVLKFVHEQEIVHQDIKPSNLICRQRDKQYCLIDFGAAIRHREPPLKDLVLGTPGYIPPEQQAGEATFASDLYALGITVVQLLTGVHPQQFKRHPITGDFDWQGYLKNRAIPPRLKDILNKLIKPNLNQRYQSATDVLADLSPQHTVAKPNIIQSKASLPHEITDSSQSTQSALTPRRSWRNRRWNPPNRITQLLGWTVGLTIAGGIIINTTTGQISRQTNAFKNTVETYLKEITQRDTLSTEFVRNIPMSAPINQLLITPQNTIVTANTASQVQLWDLTQGTIQKTLDQAPPNPSKLAVSPNGQWLVATNAQQQITIWNLKTGEVARSFNLEAGAVEAAAFSQDSSRLATSTTNRHMQIWNMETGTLERDFSKTTNSEARLTTLFYTPNNQLVCGTEDRRLVFWDAKTGEFQRTLLGHTGSIETMKASEDGKTLYSFGTDRLIAWDRQTGAIKQVFPKESGNIVEARWRDNNLLTRQRSGNLQLWNPTTGRLIKSLSENSPLSTLSPDARYFVSYTNQELKVWQITSNPQ